MTPTSRSPAASATRLIEEAGIDELRGWLALMRAGEVADPAECETLARAAKDMASTTGDLDLELRAIAQIGAALIAQGRVEDGLPLLDEAMAGSLGGEGGHFDTVVFPSCPPRSRAAGVTAGSAPLPGRGATALGLRHYGV